MDLFFSFQSLLMFFLFFLSLYFLYFYKKKNNSCSIDHILKCHPLLGHLPSFLKNRHCILEWNTTILSATTSNTFTFHRPCEVNYIITANPLNVKHMLKTNFQNYPKGKRIAYLLEDFLGGGIFNSDDDLWRIQRKTASYEFNTKSLRNFIVDNVRTEIQTRLIPMLRNSTVSGQLIDLQDVLERFAFDNICGLAFNVDPACLNGDGDGNEGIEFMLAFDEATTLTTARFMYPLPILWKAKRFLNIGSEKRLRRSIKTVHNFAEKIIRTKLEKVENNPEADLLSRFISVTGSNSDSAEFLRDIVISFILAGRDTTSSALSWFFWLLALHPHVEQEILKEIRNIRIHNGTQVGDTLNMDELQDMHYLHAAISESMRLYPPVSVDMRLCKEDDVLPDGTFIGKGWIAMYHTYAMGRMASVWGKDCCKFIPERWLENGMFRAESVFCFPVFHAGPRICLGKDMAYIQMKSIAACVIEQFEIDVIEKERCPEYVASFTLRMKKGLMVRVKERCMDMVVSS